LEDAIGDHEVKQVEHNLNIQLELIEQAIQQNKIEPENLPIMFIRVRSPKQMQELAGRLKHLLHLLTGFVFPKCSEVNARDYAETLKNISRDRRAPIYGMPILETPDLLSKETRTEAFGELSAVLHQYQD
ncbi:citrate lyase subunit beta, partial [Pseudomonas sp. GW456-E7]